jgi:hypothetical protein
MTSYLYFQEAVRFLGCTPTWLTQQITRGLVEFTLESDGKGAHRYRLNREDLKKLLGEVPVYVPQNPSRSPIMSEAKERFRSTRASIEIREEARELGISVEEYQREIRRG